MKKSTFKTTEEKKIDRQLSIIRNQVTISIIRELYHDVRPMEISRNGIKNQKKLNLSKLELEIDNTTNIFEKLTTNSNNNNNNNNVDDDVDNDVTYNNNNDESISIILNSNENQNNSSIALKDKSLTYGEVVPASFLQILSTITLLEESNKDNCTNKDNSKYNNKDLQKKTIKTLLPIEELSNNKIFVDLGCGTGKAVFTSLFEKQRLFKKVWGIELLPELIEVAIIAKNKFLETYDKIVNKSKIIEKRNIIQVNTIDNKIKDTANSTKKIISSKKEKENENLKLSKNEIVKIIEKIIINESQLFGGDIANYCISIEDLAEMLVKNIGHKVYRLSVGAKFSRFISSISDKIKIIDDKVFLYSQEELDNIALEKNKNSEIIKNITNNEIDKNNIELVSSIDDNNIDSNINTNYNKIQIKLDRFGNNVQTNIVIENKLEQILESTLVMTALEPLAEILFETGDIFLIDWWTTGDIVYAASLLFTSNMMVKLTEKVGLMKTGSWFISLKVLNLDSNLINNNRIKLITSGFYRMSWEMAEVFIYRIN